MKKKKRLTIGVTICNARIAAGLTQYQLGVLLDVNQQSIARWESCQNEPRLSTLLDVARVLDIPLLTLIRPAEGL